MLLMLTCYGVIPTKKIQNGNLPYENLLWHENFQIYGNKDDFQGSLWELFTGRQIL